MKVTPVSWLVYPGTDGRRWVEVGGAGISLYAVREEDKRMGMQFGRQS